MHLPQDTFTYLSTLTYHGSSAMQTSEQMIVNTVTKKQSNPTLDTFTGSFFDANTHSKREISTPRNSYTSPQYFVDMVVESSEVQNLQSQSHLRTDILKKGFDDPTKTIYFAQGAVGGSNIFEKVAVESLPASLPYISNVRSSLKTDVDPPLHLLSISSVESIITSPNGEGVYFNIQPSMAIHRTAANFNQALMSSIRPFISLPLKKSSYALNLPPKKAPDRTDNSSRSVFSPFITGMTGFLSGQQKNVATLPRPKISVDIDRSDVEESDPRQKVASSLQDGIIISPGELIHANSDVIIGKHGTLSPNIPLTYFQANHANMKQYHYAEQKPESKNSKIPIVRGTVPNSKVLEGNHVHRKPARNPFVDFASKSDSNVLQLPPKKPAQPPNWQFNVEKDVKKIPNHSSPLRYKPYEIRRESEANFRKPPIQKVQYFMDRSTNQPLLVNIQPSQVASIVVTQSDDPSEPHIMGQYFDVSVPDLRAELKRGLVFVQHLPMHGQPTKTFKNTSPNAITRLHADDHKHLHFNHNQSVKSNTPLVLRRHHFEHEIFNKSQSVPGTNDRLLQIQLPPRRAYTHAHVSAVQLPPQTSEKLNFGSFQRPLGPNVKSHLTSEASVRRPVSQPTKPQQTQIVVSDESSVITGDDRKKNFGTVEKVSLKPESEIFETESTNNIPKFSTTPIEEPTTTPKSSPAVTKGHPPLVYANQKNLWISAKASEVLEPVTTETFRRTSGVTSKSREEQRKPNASKTPTLIRSKPNGVNITAFEFEGDKMMKVTPTLGYNKPIEISGFLLNLEPSSDPKDLLIITPEPTNYLGQSTISSATPFYKSTINAASRSKDLSFKSALIVDADDLNNNLIGNRELPIPVGILKSQTTVLTKNKTSKTYVTPAAETSLVTHMTTVATSTSSESTTRESPVTKASLHNDKLSNYFINVVMSDRNSAVRSDIEKQADNDYEIDTGEIFRDEDLNRNDVHRVLSGGVFIPSISVDSTPCTPQCEASKSEICVEIKDGKGSCICRPGFSRLFPDRPCQPIYTYTLGIGLNEMTRDQIFSESSRNATDFALFQAMVKDALARTAMQSDLRDIYRGLNLVNFTTGPERVLLTLQLSAHTNEDIIRDTFQKYLISRNYSLGGTNIYASENLELVEVHDFNECASVKGQPHHDCSSNAICFNLRGTYQCACRDGFDDLSENFVFPGRVCVQASAGCDYCNNRGHCIENTEDKHICKCFSWYTGRKCQIDLKVITAALIATAVIFLGIMAVLIGTTFTRNLARHRSSADRRAMISRMESEACSQKSAQKSGISSHRDQHALPHLLQMSTLISTKKKIHRKRKLRQQPQMVTSTIHDGDVDNSSLNERRGRPITVAIPRAKYCSPPPHQYMPTQNYKTTSTFASDQQELIDYLEGSEKFSEMKTDNSQRNCEIFVTMKYPSRIIPVNTNK